MGSKVMGPQDDYQDGQDDNRGDNRDGNRDGNQDDSQAYRGRRSSINCYQRHQWGK